MVTLIRKSRTRRQNPDHPSSRTILIIRKKLTVLLAIGSRAFDIGILDVDCAVVRRFFCCWAPRDKQKLFARGMTASVSS